MNMKVRDIVEKFFERFKKSVFKCYEKCGFFEMEVEFEFEVDREIIEFLKVLFNLIRFKILKFICDNWFCVCLFFEVFGED